MKARRAVERLYRASLWLPLIVPAAVMVTMNVLIRGFGVAKPSGRLDLILEMVAWSGLFGGLPYLALALWARWWMRDRTEREVVRLMLLAPLLMIGVFWAFCAVLGLFADRFTIWLRIAWELSSLILVLGYGYVGLTLLVRWLLELRPGVLLPRPGR